MHNPRDLYPASYTQLIYYLCTITMAIDDPRHLLYYPVLL